MRRNKRLAGAALAAALATGCKRPPEAPTPADGVTLDAPAPSSTVVTSPLANGASVYTNEMQAQNLRDQAAALGISGLAKPSTPGNENEMEGPHRTITYQEGIERTAAMTRQAMSERHAIEGDKNKSVSIPTETAGVLPANSEGSPIETSTDTGPKDP